MRILSIAWYKILPPVFGGQKGIACFNEYLSRRVDLTCLCSKDNEAGYPASYKIIPQLPVDKTQFINPFCWKKIVITARRENATHIILEHPYHAIAAWRAKKKCGAMLILHSHNIESERFRELGKTGWRILRWYEKWIHRKAGLVLFKTKADQEFAVTHFGISNDRCLVIPYGIEKKENIDRASASSLIRKRYSINPEEKILLFAGTLDYTPNAKAVEAIYSTIAPKLAAGGSSCRIIVCGRIKEQGYRHLANLQHPLVIYAGEVTDIDNYFAAADIFINPVQTGGGIQTKNIEALNHHCNLVCFEDMVDKDTAAVAGEKIFTAAAGDWDGFIQQVSKAVILQKETPTPFFDYYYWENIIDRLVPWLV